MSAGPRISQITPDVRHGSTIKHLRQFEEALGDLEVKHPLSR
jgi:hypothetical protein